jgi:hypothetical protein
VVVPGFPANFSTGGDRTIGLAWEGSACTAGSQSTRFEDQGPVGGPTCACNDGSPELQDAACQTLVSNGNCAGPKTQVGVTCPDGLDACTAAAAVVSDTGAMWRTLAHELGHALGASHTFAEGGLMAYQGEYAFADTGDVCAWLATHGTCLPAVGATCGNGMSARCNDDGESGTRHVTGRRPPAAVVS